MNQETLRAIKKVIGDMRFMQAASLVASGLSDNKDAIKYMRELAQLERLIDKELGLTK